MQLSLSDHASRRRESATPVNWHDLLARSLQANLKKLFGARYERLPRTLLIWAVVFFALRSSGIHVEIAPAVLWLSTAVATVGGFVQVLTADDTIDSVRGQLMLPTPPLVFHGAFSLSVASYTFLTKTGLLLVLYLALSPIDTVAIAGFSACFLLCALVTYPLVFRVEKNDAPHQHSSAVRHSFARYVLRYVMHNKGYLLNMVVMWAFGCVLAYMFAQTGFPAAAVLGMAVVCINTPLGIVLSSDKALYRHIRFLPRQAVAVFIPYALVVSLAATLACGLYLATWQVLTGSISTVLIVAAIVAIIVVGPLTVFLELRFPLLNWTVTSDLWHHPRKYIVPATMVVLLSPLMLAAGGM